MSALLLLRHGPTAATGKVPAGQRDDTEGDRARHEWPAIRERLAARAPRRVLCSDLRRCRIPAEDLAGRCGLAAEVLAELREQDFGSWTGREWEEFPAGHPLFADPVATRPPGGESFADCARRVCDALLPRLGADPEPVLVLAHAGPLRALAGALLAIPLWRRLDLAWDPWGLSEFAIHGRCGVLRAHNHRA